MLRKVPPIVVAEESIDEAKELLNGEGGLKFTMFLLNSGGRVKAKNLDSFERIMRLFGEKRIQGHSWTEREKRLGNS